MRVLVDGGVLAMIGGHNVLDMMNAISKHFTPIAIGGYVRHANTKRKWTGPIERVDKLFEASKHRMKLRAHDLRGTFVTLSLASGETEAWVATRTGHKSTLMISRYKSEAMTAAELNLGRLVPLHLGIPELAEIDLSGTGSGNVIHVRFGQKGR